jgi:hypothetical protein
MRINLFILINYSPAVKRLNNGLNERLFKLNENIPTVKLIKINLFTSYSYIYLIIKIKFKIGNSWYTAKTLLNSNTERNFILQILIAQLHLTPNGRDIERVKTLDGRYIQIYNIYRIETQIRNSLGT